MLDRYDRQRVEAVKMASTISIRINEGTPDELTLQVKPIVKDIKKLRHDIALALQDYFNVER